LHETTDRYNIVVSGVWTRGDRGDRTFGFVAQALTELPNG